MSLRFLWLGPDTDLGFRGGGSMDKEEAEGDPPTEEPWRGKDEGGGGDARRFPLRFEVEEETLPGGSESVSDISEFLEDGV